MCNQIFCLGNSPPEVATDIETFRVNVGEANIYTFKVTDTNDFSVMIDGGMPDGGDLTDDGAGTYTFTWTPEAIPTRGLSFVATDDLGAATLHSPFVQVCACVNGGECTLDGVPSTLELIQNLPCVCNEGNLWRNSLSKMYSDEFLWRRYIIFLGNIIHFLLNQL